MPALQKGEAVEVSAESQLISVEMSYGWDLKACLYAGWIGFKIQFKKCRLNVERGAANAELFESLE